MTTPESTVRRSLLAAAAAVTLLLTACGSDEAATPAPVASAAEQAPSEGMSMSVTPTTTAGGDTTELDEQSTTWIATFCGGLGPITGMGEMPMDSPEDAGAALKEAATSLTDVAAELEELPPPTFDGGDELAARTIAGFKELGTTFAEAGDAASSGDQAALQEAVSSMMNSSAMQEMGQIGTTPEIDAAVAQIPECQEAGITE